jgi:hypothetical protein
MHRVWSEALPRGVAGGEVLLGSLGRARAAVKDTAEVRAAAATAATAHLPGKGLDRAAFARTSPHFEHAHIERRIERARIERHAYLLIQPHMGKGAV